MIEEISGGPHDFSEATLSPKLQAGSQKYREKRRKNFLLSLGVVPHAIPRHPVFPKLADGLGPPSAPLQWPRVIHTNEDPCSVNEWLLGPIPCKVPEKAEVT